MMDKQELIEKYEKLIQQNEPELEESKLAESRSKLYNNILRELKRMDDGITTEQAWEKIAEEYKLPVETVQQIAGTTISSAVKKEDIAISDGCIILNPNLTEPEKPEIPKFVADWIRGFRILNVTDLDIIGLYFSKEIEKKCEQWITDNFNDFIKALVNGYTEKAPVWIVKAPYDRYFGGFLEKGQHVEINFSHINRDNAQKFEDKSKAVAVATLVDGEVEEWSGKDEQ